MGEIVKGCHNCEHAGKVFDSWKSSPCAKCPNINFKSKSLDYDDIAYAEEYADPRPIPGEEIDDKRNWIKALSSCVLELVELSRKAPKTYKYAMTKLREPELSYLEIARRFGCRKQNIQYHLRKARKLFPPLASALVVDQRFNRRK